MSIHKICLIVRFSGLFVAVVASITGCAAPRPAATFETERRAIVQVLTTQTAAWNRGDLPGFMAGYWVSDSLVFIGRKGPTYGWQNTLAGYQKSFPSAAAMGQLDFSGLRVASLGPDAAQVVGHWHLALPVAEGDVQGWFLLIFRKINGRWLVVADHTNETAPEKK